MIFTACVNCDEAKTLYYECGDQSMGQAERWECEKCKAVNFSEHLSMGETMSEEEFFKRHPEAKKAVQP